MHDSSCCSLTCGETITSFFKLGFSVVEAEDNLIVIALASVAGVLFLFLVCFVVTYRVHRKNKRKEKMKISVKNFQQTSSQEVGQNHAYLR